VDITPLIDMMFMLIIFFVLTAVFIQGVIPVDLPKGNVPRAEDKRPVMVTVTKDARVFWAGEPVSPGSLAGLAGGAITAGDDIFISGDGEAPYGAVAELLDELRGLGVESVRLVFGGEKNKNVP
jgi:biopolymer transport protein ExbD